MNRFENVKDKRMSALPELYTRTYDNSVMKFTDCDEYGIRENYSESMHDFCTEVN
jgi:hypothetical protein